MVIEMSNEKKRVPIIQDFFSADLINSLLYLYSLFAGGIVLYRKLDSLKTNYRIKKDFSSKDVFILSLSDEIKLRVDDFNFDEISKINHSKEILHFIDVVTKNFKAEDLAFMVNNLNNLNVYNFKLEDYFRTDGMKGYYNSANNSIFLHEHNPNEYIYHELFHAASTMGDDDTFCVGFANYGITSIGYGFNEGYTQLLTNRYFPSKKGHLFYPYLTKIAGIVEDIMGKDDMQSMYMRGELNLLFSKLESFCSRQDVVNFMVYLDNICNHLYNYGLNKESKELLNQSLYEINVILTRIMINKTIAEMNGVNLNITTLYNKIIPLFRKLPANINYVHFKCNFWNDTIAFDTLCDELKDALDLNHSKRK